jgi:hypothetical protein
MDGLRIRKQRNQMLYHIHDMNGNIISSHHSKREANKNLKMMLNGGVRIHPKIKEHLDYLTSFYTPEYLTKLAKDILNYGSKKISKLAYELIKILGITVATLLAHQLLAQFGISSNELTRYDYQNYINSLPTKK